MKNVKSTHSKGSYIYYECSFYFMRNSNVLRIQNRGTTQKSTYGKFCFGLVTCSLRSVETSFYG